MFDRVFSGLNDSNRMERGWEELKRVFMDCLCWMTTLMNESIDKNFVWIVDGR